MYALLLFIIGVIVLGRLVERVDIVRRCSQGHGTGKGNQKLKIYADATKNFSFLSTLI